MEMHQIRYFLAVCDAGNFTRAAKTACVSQPSLTQAIQKLEDELGGLLFLRDRGGCRLTELGRMVEPNLRRILEESQTIKAEAVRFMRIRKTPLRIGLIPSIGARRLGPLLVRFQKAHPSAEVELIVEPEIRLLKHLQSEAIDMVIGVPIETQGGDYDIRTLYKERYGVVFPKSHRFGKLKKVGLQDIQREPYLDRLNCEMREGLKAACVQREVILYATYRSNNEDWILQMVRGGIGVAIIPEHTLPEGADDVGFHYLDDPPLNRNIVAILPGDRPVKNEIHSLMGFLSA